MMIETVVGSSGWTRSSPGGSHSTDNGPTKIVPGAVTFQNTEAMTRVSGLQGHFIQHNKPNAARAKTYLFNKIYLE
jgi:hypothetical protein